MNAPPREVRITDSTLRDGSHAMRHQFTEEQVRAVVSALDGAGVQVIEVSHGDGLGGSSFNYGFSLRDEFELIAAAVDEITQARIAVLLLPGVGTIDDLRHARDAGASVARIATHCTEADVSVQHFGAARDMGMETVGFLMLSHRVAVSHDCHFPSRSFFHSARRVAARSHAILNPRGSVLPSGLIAAILNSSGPMRA